jgi:hypothetical protein
MKSIFAQTTFVLTIALTCAHIAIGQEQPAIPPATAYTYSAYNVTGASNTLAYAINNSGEIVGYITGGDCAQISDQTSCGFVDAKGTVTVVACELADATDFFDVSNTGEVIGAAAFVNSVTGIIWEGNEDCSGVSPSGTDFAEAWGVADGNIVGYYTASGGNYEGFLLNGTTGVYTNIKCPGFVNTRAYGINGAGLIVGDVSSASGPVHGMSYNAGKCTVFDYPKAASTSAKGINKGGTISSGAFHGFVKAGTSFTALNYPSATQTQAYHLNDQGQVAGVYTDTSGADHGFIAHPKQ